MAPPLDLVLRHNAWANRALFEFCSGLEPAALDRATPGTYGTVLTTIQHIVSGEQWYIWLLCGEMLGAPVDERVPRPLDELRAIASRTGQRAIELAATDDADRTVLADGKPWKAGVIYAQMIHHGNEHRAQAKSILGANGIEPPGVSVWGYAMENTKLERPQ
jgi:uncharacterized damage-inducible protein DinB